MWPTRCYGMTIDVYVPSSRRSVIAANRVDGDGSPIARLKSSTAVHRCRGLCVVAPPDLVSPTVRVPEASGVEDIPRMCPR